MSPLAAGIIACLFTLLAVTLWLARVASRAAGDPSLGMDARATRHGPALLDRLVARAGWSITGTELGLVWTCAAAALGGGTAAAGLSPLGVAGALAAAAAAVPVAALLCARRAARGLEVQFGEAMPLIAADIKAGGTVTAALGSVAATADEPLRTQLGLVLARTRAGMPIEEALKKMAEDTGSVDVGILSTAVWVQQRHGGSIAPVVEQIGETISDRLELRRLIVARSTSMTMAVRVITVAVALIVVVSAFALEQGRAFYGQPIGWLAGAGIAGMLLAANLVAARLRDFIL